MWDLIVLGEVPGTGVQVTFENWLYIVGAVIWLAAIVWCIANRRLLASWRIARVIQQEVNHTSSRLGALAMASHSTTA